MFGDREGERDGISSSEELPALEELSWQALLPKPPASRFLRPPAAVVAAGAEKKQQGFNCCECPSVINTQAKRRGPRHQG